MKQTLLWGIAFVLGFGAMTFVSFAQVTVTDNEDLNTLFTILDEELAQWEAINNYDADDELANAVSVIHDLEITKFDTPDTYMSDNAIRRDEAATMFFRFADSMDMLGDVVNSDCDFPDLDQGHSDLISVMQDSCSYGLFKWANGYFLPTTNITNAQAITVMARIIYGYQDETSGHWADNYYNLLSKDGYLTNLAMDSTGNYDQTVTRWDIAILLSRVYYDLN